MKKILFILLFVLPLIGFGQSTTGYMNNSGSVFKTTDSGVTWTEMSYTGNLEQMSFVNDNTTSLESLIKFSNRKLVKTTNTLGQENTTIKNQLMIEIYDDGSTEKKIVLE